MPQANIALRRLMEKWFGDRIADDNPRHFLASRGYVLRDDWCWAPPTPAHSVSFEEAACVLFLMEEWDYGGIWGMAYPERCGPLMRMEWRERIRAALGESQ